MSQRRGRTHDGGPVRRQPPTAIQTIINRMVFEGEVSTSNETGLGKTAQDRVVLDAQKLDWRQGNPPHQWACSFLRAGNYVGRILKG